jgi:predicted transglutaminase-like cysteine proteinase
LKLAMKQCRHSAVSRGESAVSIADPFVPTDAQVEQFRHIHRQTFDAFEYVPDERKWKTNEYWVHGKDILAMAKVGHYRGDCEDLALIERHACRQIDLPNRLVFCWVPRANGYHIILECGGWIADCNHPHIMRRDDLDYLYRWISISGYNPGDPWHYVKGFDPAAPWPHQ